MRRELVTLGKSTKFCGPRKAQPGRWADPLGDAIKAARAWCRGRGGGGDGDAAEKEPLVAVTVDRSASRDDDAEG